jgi:epoxyqueuosine reductase QueG
LRPRPVLAGKNAAQLSQEMLDATDDELRIALRGSPMKRARLAGLRRNASIVLDNLARSNATTGVKRNDG